LLFGLLLAAFLGGTPNMEGLENNNNKRTNEKGATNAKNGNRNGKKTSNLNYEDYNHYSGSSSKLQTGARFTGTDGGEIKVITATDGTQSLEVTSAIDSTPIIYTSVPPSETVVVESETVEGFEGEAARFYGPNGETATVVVTEDGRQAIQITTSNGTRTYTSEGNAIYNPAKTTDTQYYGATGYQYPPFDANAYTTPGYNAPGAVGGPGYNPPGYNSLGASYGSAAGVGGPGYNPPGAAGAGNPPGYNAPGYNGVGVGGPGYNPPGAAGVGNPPGYNAPGIGAPGANYYDTLPPGIPASQIPPGQEDLYILKSQVVPPVCPACPTSTTCPREEPCPACPPCARCPEPSFECKKVPNYNALASEFLPMPVLNDFSSFGM